MSDFGKQLAVIRTTACLRIWHASRLSGNASEVVYAAVLLSTPALFGRIDVGRPASSCDSWHPQRLIDGVRLITLPLRA